MGFDDAPDEAEAEARAVDLTVKGAAAAIEGIEDVVPLIGGDAGAAVGNADFDGGLAIVSGGSGGDADPAAFAAILSGIGHEILQRVEESGGIAGDAREMGIHVAFDLAFGFTQGGGAGAEGVLDEGRGADGFANPDNAAGFGAGKAQDLFDNGLEFFGFGFNERTVAGDLGGSADEAGGEVMAGRANDGKRGTQFVRYAGDKLHLEPGEALGFAGGVDEHGDGGEHQQEDGGGDGEVAEAGALDHDSEGARAIANEEGPAAAEGRSGAHPFGSGAEPWSAAQELLIRDIKETR